MFISDDEFTMFKVQLIRMLEKTFSTENEYNPVKVEQDEWNRFIKILDNDFELLLYIDTDERRINENSEIKVRCDLIGYFDEYAITELENIDDIISILVYAKKVYNTYLNAVKELKQDIK